MFSSTPNDELATMSDFHYSSLKKLSGLSLAVPIPRLGTNRLTTPTTPNIQSATGVSPAGCSLIGCRRVDLTSARCRNKQSGTGCTYT